MLEVVEWKRILGKFSGGLSLLLDPALIVNTFRFTDNQYSVILLLFFVRNYHQTAPQNPTDTCTGLLCSLRSAVKYVAFTTATQYLPFRALLPLGCNCQYTFLFR